MHGQPHGIPKDEKEDGQGGEDDGEGDDAELASGCRLDARRLGDEHREQPSVRAGHPRGGHHDARAVRGRQVPDQLGVDLADTWQRVERDHRCAAQRGSGPGDDVTVVVEHLADPGVDGLAAGG